MSFDWRELASHVDAAVDEFFAQPVILRPWSQPNDFAEGSADNSRDAVDCFGVYQTRDANVASASGGFMTKMAQGQVGLSIQRRFVDEAKLQKGDMVAIPQENIVCEVSYIDLGDTGRSFVHLLRSNIIEEALMAVRPSKVFAMPAGSLLTLKHVAKAVEQ